MSDYIKYIRSKVGQDSILLPFAAGILEDQYGRILLQKRADTGNWGVPGGCMELGESSLDTVIREFFEETGIQVEALKLLNVYTNFETLFPNGDRAQTVGIVYKLRAIAPYDINGVTNEETLELAFFSEERIKDILLVNEQHQHIIEEYFSGNYKLGY
ncbi:MutT/nudix family protein [Streptococcus porcinus]|uniref:NUDIX hydrolase n=1 Tax=Streptococcus porcinus TaxID=1340 RepID=UPI0010CACB89|nr:NUDIX domain-containing protein [Streptococcus porcinus]VTS36602.1 MutT/nudix family protein [Streptococcus porcinus]